MDEPDNLELLALREREEELARALDDLAQLRQDNATLRRQRDSIDDRLSEIQASIGWLFMVRLAACD